MARVIIASSSYGVDQSNPLHQLWRAGLRLRENLHDRRLSEAEVAAFLENDAGVAQHTASGRA